MFSLFCHLILLWNKHFVDELDNLLAVGTQDPLRELVGDGRLTRHKLAGQFLYCAADRAHQTHQLRARRLLMATPGLVRPLPEAGGLQLLLPLCLVRPDQADLALVVERENQVYRASTVLTLDMAYNNARLVARPDTEWLDP